MMKRKPFTSSVYIFYCIIFYTVWIVRELLLRPILEHVLGEWTNALIGAAIKLMVWTIPAIFLIKYYTNDMYISFQQMLCTKVKWFRYILLLAGFLMYHLIITYFSFGKIGVNPKLRAVSFIGTVLFVGITEEAVFRGWLLNVTLKRLKPWYSVLLNAGLFLLIHFPIWIYKGMFTNPATILQSCLGVFLLGIVFGWTFMRSKNIFVPITLHMGWNLFNIIFFGS